MRILKIGGALLCTLFTILWYIPINASANVIWTPAGQLAQGDILKTADGKIANVLSIKKKTVTRPMYNLTINQSHNFFVGDQDISILVHNVCNDFRLRDHNFFMKMEKNGGGCTLKTGACIAKFANDTQPKDFIDKFMKKQSVFDAFLSRHTGGAATKDVVNTLKSLGIRPVEQQTYWLAKEVNLKNLEKILKLNNGEEKTVYLYMTNHAMAVVYKNGRYYTSDRLFSANYVKDISPYFNSYESLTHSIFDLYQDTKIEGFSRYDIYSG